MALRIQGLTALQTQIKNIAKLAPQGEIVDGLADGAQAIVDQAKHNVCAQTLTDTMALHDSIKLVKINQFRVDLEVGVEYGATHEFGLGNQSITPRQRRFFWAKFRETGDDMWKALALSQTYTIPARPYLRPAIDEKQQAMVKGAAASIDDKIKKAVLR